MKDDESDAPKSGSSRSASNAPSSANRSNSRKSGKGGVEEALAKFDLAQAQQAKSPEVFQNKIIALQKKITKKDQQVEEIDSKVRCDY